MKVGDKVRLKQVDSNDDIYIFSWAEYELLRDKVLTIASMKPLGSSGKNSVQFAYPDDIKDEAPFDDDSFYYYEDIILGKVDNMLTEIV